MLQGSKGRDTKEKGTETLGRVFATRLVTPTVSLRRRLRDKRTPSRNSPRSIRPTHSPRVKRRRRENPTKKRRETNQARQQVINTRPL